MCYTKWIILLTITVMCMCHIPVVTNVMFTASGWLVVETMLTFSVSVCCRPSPVGVSKLN